MTPPELPGFARARRAYVRTRVIAAARATGFAVAVVALAVALHRTTPTTYLLGGVLAITLATFGYVGGAFARGARAGLLAGLPPLIGPSIVFALAHGGHCADCASPTLACVGTCLGTGLAVGALVGARALREPGSSARFALAAFATAAATGLLGCGTTGLAGAVGVVVGLAAGGVTGWRATKTLGYPQA